MKSHLTRTVLGIASLVLITGCGAAGGDATGSHPVAETEASAGTQTEASADGTRDGWVLRASWYSPPMTCPWSPDQVERMMESGRPLPTCVRRLQRWFREHYDPDWQPSGPTASR